MAPPLSSVARRETALATPRRSESSPTRVVCVWPAALEPITPCTSGALCGWLALWHSSPILRLRRFAHILQCRIGSGLSCGQTRVPSWNKADPLAVISDDELLRRLGELLRQSRRVESDLVAHIAEVDERRLYVREAAPSMFAYCTEVLHLSEAEAYLRITVARASREHPVLLDMLADGRIHLTGIARLVPHLSPANRAALLARATHKSRRQIEELIAEIAPRPAAPAAIRRLPDVGVARVQVAIPETAEARPQLEVPRLRPDRAGVAAPGSGLRGDAASLAPVPGRDEAIQPAAIVRVPASGESAHTSVRASLIQPLGAARYKVQFTAGVELRDKLERLRALMRSQIPDGDLASVIEQAVSEKLARLESRRFAKTNRPRKGRGEPDASSHTPDTGCRPARRLRARRGPMPVRGRVGPAMFGA